MSPSLSKRMVYLFFLFLETIYLSFMMLFGVEFAVIINLLIDVLCIIVFMEL